MASESDAVARELSAIKRLLVLMLVRDGFTQAQVGAALGVDRTSVSRMFPKGMLSSLAKGNDLE
tara:strand:- start:120 stop:311 length:192 start_codon:yes stop_codon:yes gene_type:complete